jgi:hypothetical protein
MAIMEKSAYLKRQSISLRVFHLWKLPRRLDANSLTLRDLRAFAFRSNVVNEVPDHSPRWYND